MQNSVRFANADLFLVHEDKEWLNTKKIEEIYKAKYLGVFCLTNKSGDFANTDFFCFYQDKPHPTGSNYFALYINHQGRLMITDAITITKGEWSGKRSSNHVLYSAYRHDYQSLFGVVADGGRDYFKSTEVGEKVRFKIENGKIILTQGATAWLNSPVQSSNSPSPAIRTPINLKSPKSVTTKASSKKESTKPVTSPSTSQNKRLCQRTYKILSD